MTFLAPAAFGLLALALPIIAFYLVKTRVPKRVITTLLFWDQVTPRLMQQPFWRQLRRWISLALQLLFLTLLVLALMRPQPSGQSMQPQRSVYVLQASASMQARAPEADSRWEQALQTVRGEIGRQRYFDESAIVLATDPPRILSGWTSSQRTLKKALEDVKPAATDEDSRPALALAKNLALSREGGSVIFVTDGVLNHPPEARGKGEKPPLQIVRVGDQEAVNTGLTLFAARRSAVAPGEYQIAASIESNEKIATTVQFTLMRDGRLMDAQTVNLEPGKPWQKSWPEDGPEAATFTATITGMKRDDLADDNTGSASVPALCRVSVLLVSPPNGFFEAMLQALDLVDWKRVDPGQDSTAAVATADLVIYDKCTPSPAARPRATLLIAPPGEGFWGQPGEEIVAPLVSDWQKESAPLRHVSLDQVRLQKSRAFTPPAGTPTLAESFGQPLIWGDWEEREKWLALGFDLDQSDLVFRTAFPVLIGNLVQSLRGGADTDEPAPSGVPGPVITRLAVTIPEAELQQAAAPAATPTLAFIGAHPLWWWLVAAGVLWLVMEWRLYARRVTE